MVSKAQYDILVYIMNEAEPHLHLDAPRNRFLFEQKLSSFDQYGHRKIMFAYTLAKAALKTQQRESGERSFEHAREVALILLSELKKVNGVGITDPDIIEAALLHDTLEDTSIFGSSYALRPLSDDEDTEFRQITYSEWKEEVYWNISEAFSPKVAEMVLGVTKPKPDGAELPTQEDADQMYIEGLKEALPDTILIKMPDRLHNLRTLLASTPEKQARKIKETEEIYFPIFEQARDVYPRETEYLLQEMKKAIEAVRKSWSLEQTLEKL